MAYNMTVIKNQVIAHVAYHTGSLEISFLKDMRRNPHWHGAVWSIAGSSMALCETAGCTSEMVLGSGLNAKTKTNAKSQDWRVVRLFECSTGCLKRRSYKTEQSGCLMRGSVY